MLSDCSDLKGALPEEEALHRYVCLEGRQAMHMKGTLVRQAASSTYKLTEARLGGRLTRQDVNVAQVRHLGIFILCP